jgi:2-polyprenyl-3-methyl-5-hydroxy-6-metoxy-1,4-benzoquinol methylase
MRELHEIEHGRRLARLETERVWGWDTPAGQVRARRRGELIARSARLSPGTSALEVGCGTGLFTEMFAKSGARLVAIDVSNDLLGKASERHVPPDQVRFLRANFNDFEWPDRFDAVVGSSVLHHLDLTLALGRILRLLKPGGVMSFAEPNMANPQIFLERKLRRLFPYVSPDETAFVRWRLGRDLAKAGFVAIKITPFDWLHPSTPASAIGIVSRVGVALEGIPGAREFSGSLHISAERPAVAGNM